jgi:hypothetical protein
MAVRRWPAQLREEQRREWTAELEALRGEPGSARRRLGFVWSLAMSPGPAEGSGVRGWRELLPGLGARLRPAAGFAVLSLLVVQLLPLRFQYVESVSQPPALTIDLGWLVAVAVPLCFLAGRRSSLPPETSAVGIAGVVATGAALGDLSYRFVQSFLYSGGGQALASLVAPFVLVALVTPLLAGVLILGRRGRRRSAVALGFAGLPVVALVAWLLAPGTSATASDDALTHLLSVRFWRAGSALDAPRTHVLVALPLLALAALALAYSLGLVFRRPPQSVAPATTAHAWRPSRAGTAAGILALVVGLASWTYTAAALGPMLGRPRYEFLIAQSAWVDLPPQWVDELRWAAIALAAFGMFVAWAGRRGAVLAATVLGGWLLAGDATLSRLGFAAGGPGRVAATLAVAVAGLVLARWIVGVRATLPEAEALGVRRGLAVVAVTAAACGPLLLTNGVNAVINPDLPRGLTVLMGLVPATFATLAVFAAASARRPPARAGLVWPLAVASVLVMVVGGIATTMHVDQSLSLLIALVGAGLLTVATAGLAMGSRRPRHLVATLGCLLPGVLVVAPASLFASIVPAILLRASVGVNDVLGSMTFVPGAIVLGIPTASALARRLIGASVR